MAVEVKDRLLGVGQRCLRVIEGSGTEFWRRGRREVKRATCFMPNCSRQRIILHIKRLRTCRGPSGPGLPGLGETRAGANFLDRGSTAPFTCIFAETSLHSQVLPPYLLKHLLRTVSNTRRKRLPSRSRAVDWLGKRDKLFCFVIQIQVAK